MATSDKQVIFSLIGVGRVHPPKRQVLKDIYLSFYYGAKIGVLGANGSGKSTLLRIIGGVDKNYTGEITFSKGYSVGLLEQEPQLDPSAGREPGARWICAEAGLGPALIHYFVRSDVQATVGIAEWPAASSFE